MAEVYPSDNELLNMQSESETGIEYIPTGTAPYYLHFRKLLYRLLLAARRANDLRVYDEGGLDVGVKLGKFWLGTVLIATRARRVIRWPTIKQIFTSTWIRPEHSSLMNTAASPIWQRHLTFAWPRSAPQAVTSTRSPTAGPGTTSQCLTGPAG